MYMKKCSNFNGIVFGFKNAEDAHKLLDIQSYLQRKITSKRVFESEKLVWEKSEWESTERKRDLNDDKAK